MKPDDGAGAGLARQPGSQSIHVIRTAANQPAPEIVVRLGSSGLLLQHEAERRVRIDSHAEIQFAEQAVGRAISVVKA